MCFGFNKTNLHWARAVVAGEAIAHIVKEDEAVSATVGGPLQVIRITSDGLEEHCIWPSGEGDRNVQVRYHQSRTTIQNPSTGKEYTLLPIWDFPLHGLNGMG